MPNKLVVFDFDSTLMDGETIEYIAEAVGLREEIGKITTLAMQGGSEFFDSLIQRVAMLRGISEEKVNEICRNLPYTKGAKETIAGLKSMGFKVICFSGGFKNATEYAKNILGYDADFSNILRVKDGFLTGYVGGPMMFSDSKGIMLQKLQNILDVKPENTIAVGDGANDLSMFKHAGTRIAFCAKPIVKASADIIVEEKDLTNILKLI